MTKGCIARRLEKNPSRLQNHSTHMLELLVRSVPKASLFEQIVQLRHRYLPAFLHPKSLER